MAYTEVFISESVMDERGNRVQCLGVISYYEGRGAKIALQIQRGGDGRPWRSP